MTTNGVPGGSDEAEQCDEPVAMAPSIREKLMFWVAIFLLGILILLVVFVNVPATRASAGTTMTKTDWQLQSYADTTGVMIPALSNPPVIVRFMLDGTLTGTSGCNNYSAAYTTKELDINITQPIRSARVCSAPGVIGQEDAYLADLPASAEIRLTESSLKMFSKTGKPLLVFIPHS